MANWKIEKRERANIAGLVYYSKYGVIPYEATAKEWGAFFKKVLPSELPNVLHALSAHLIITQDEPEASTEPEAETGEKKKGK